MPKLLMPGTAKSPLSVLMIGRGLTQQHSGDALDYEREACRVHGVNADPHQLRLAVCEVVSLAGGSVAIASLILLVLSSLPALLQQDQAPVIYSAWSMASSGT